ncbi:hypothetical protein AB0E59_32290 [Lentzea sp. NPDC034063]|uniref:hypothetical protein n=1 Tax=Lentzea sp. NPDC034063 TaxID=3154912 RepID=UPI0034003BFF
MPFADVGPLKIESDLTDGQVLFLSDIQPSDVVAVWGAGPVGQFAMESATVLGAAKVIAIDKEPYRLRMAEQAGHTPVNFEEVDVRSESDRPHVLRQAIMSCRSGGVVSVIGVYGGLIDKFPAGAWMNRSLTLRTGQCHVRRYMVPLLERIERGEIDPTRIITHTLPLEEAERGFEMFKNKQDDCEKVVLKP